MNWLEITIPTTSPEMDPLLSALDDLGVDGVVINDEAVVNDFLENGKKYGVFPMVFNDAQHAEFVSFDLPEQYRFNYRTMCGFKTSNQNPYAKKVFQYIKKYQKEFVF